MSTSCVHKYIAYGFISGSIATILLPMNDSMFKESLNMKQKNIYKRITYERMYIFFIGCIISFIFTTFLQVEQWTKVVVFYILLGVFYKCHPKSYYMVEHLNNSHQLQLWNSIYKEMQFKHACSLLLSILSIPLLCTK